MSKLVLQANLGGAVSLVGPNTANNVDFTLPSADGAANTVMTTDGAGTLSFQAVPTITSAGNLTGGSTGTIPYQSATGTTAMLAVGTNGQVLTTHGAGSAPTWTTPVAPSFQEFTSSGTWTKPSSATFVMVEVWGAGGGASAGMRNTGSTPYPKGGSGGGGGAYMYQLLKASDLTSTVSVTIGAGGAGGTGGTGLSGNAGAAGGNSSFGSYVISYGGGATSTTQSGSTGCGGGTMSYGGAGGTQNGSEPALYTTAGSAIIGGAFGGTWTNVGNAIYGYGGSNSGFGGGSGGTNNADTYAIGGGGGSSFGGGGGGSGGPCVTNNTPYGGSAGGGKTGVGSGGLAGAAGSAGSAGGAFQGGGGGGASNGGTAGSGGAGGIAGGGGGGGGASNSGTSGSGGNGGPGLVRVYSW